MGLTLQQKAEAQGLLREQNQTQGFNVLYLCFDFGEVTHSFSLALVDQIVMAEFALALKDLPLSLAAWKRRSAALWAFLLCQEPGC
jgi:hypothetical protein